MFNTAGLKTLLAHLCPKFGKEASSVTLYVVLITYGSKFWCTLKNSLFVFLGIEPSVEDFLEVDDDGEETVSKVSVSVSNDEVRKEMKLASF